ncbi:unnamed protein product [Ilex paraguariensis]|uniref:Fe2OG dioxygenase domain-containing protein n=1 Tax=Ilex paraguariensis TaxID=185542 RepID=A0ABC8R7B0_9AQUA
MEVLISNWSNVQSMPESFVFPPERRPGKNLVPVCNDIPVIDLKPIDEDHDPAETIQQILKASQEFGFFQVINHGVSEVLMDDTMSVFKEFFGLPAEYKASFYSNDINRSCRLYTSTLNYDKEEFHYWRDNFTHRCHPVDDYIQFWPEKPSRYRDVVGQYSVEVRKFLLRILDLMCEGLGLELRYFDGEFSKNQLLSVNYHVPCPDPSLTLGMPEHSDPNLISMLQQCDVPGLQFLKDGQWIGVEPLPNALLVIPGLQLRAISNDKFQSPKHRVVTHSKEARTTIGCFLIPSNDVCIEPARALVNSGSPQFYRAYKYQEFFSTFTVKGCDADAAFESFKLHG